MLWWRARLKHSAWDISAQRGCNTSPGEQKGFCFQRGCSGTEAFGQRASPCPAPLGCALHPWAVPGELWSSWRQRAGTPRVPLARAMSSQTTRSHQLLSKPCIMEPLGGKEPWKPRSSHCSCARRGDRGRTGRIPALGMTCWVQRAAALWGNKAFLGCSLYFCRNGGGRADGKCLWKLFIFNPVESYGLFLVFGL